MKNDPQKPNLDQPATYAIKVPGHLDNNWSDWTEEIQLTTGIEPDGTPVTVLTCTVDQATLQGLLRHLYSLGIPLISVVCKDIKRK